MKAEVNIDTQGLVMEIAQEVVKAIRPLLSGRAEDDTAVYDVDGLAEYLKVSKKWIYERVQFKEIPYVKICGHLRFKKSDITRWIDSHKIPDVNPLSRPLRVIR